MLYGVSGSGKSRSLFEIVGSKIKNRSFKKTYIINPRNIIGHALNRISISELVDKIEQRDVIIWNDFPDDLLISQNIESELESLDKVSSANVKNLFVTLNPKLLTRQNELKKIYNVVQKEVKNAIRDIGSKRSTKI